MDARERFSDQKEMLRAAMDRQAAGMQTALPGIVQSALSAQMTVSVQIAIRAVVQNPDGSFKNVSLPLLVDVPVCFPSGGGYTLTFPISPGDECLVIFSSRDINAWWDTGSEQNPATARMFDLSDSFAIIGPRSRPKVIGAISASKPQLRSNSGNVYLEVDGPGGNVTIHAPGAITLDGNVQVNGNVVASGTGTFAGVGVTTHHHDGVQTGGGSTGGPVG